MSPDYRSRRSKRSRRSSVPRQVRIGPSSDDAHEVVYFLRRNRGESRPSAPGRDFLRSCPPKVRATMRAVLAEVAACPPKRFAGGGYWEAMKGAMTGWFEVRVDGPKRHHYRLFCLLDYEAEGREKPLLVVVTGLDKPFRTVLSEADYKQVRELGEEYRTRNPRSVV